MPPKAKRPRNEGRQQRAAAAAAAAAAVDDDSELGPGPAAGPAAPSPPDRFIIDSETVRAELLEWAWRGSSTRVQKACHNAYTDMLNLLTSLGASESLSPSSLVRLARLGDSGRRKGNIQRDLKAALGAPDSPEPLSVNVPVKCTAPLPGGRSTEWVNLPLLAPHLNFQFLFNNDRARFDDCYFGQPFSAESLSSFWKKVVSRRDPRIAHHPMCRRDRWMERAIPIAIHGDGVACVRVSQAGTNTYDVYSSQSALVRGASSVVKQFHFGIWIDIIVKPSAGNNEDTMREYWNGFCSRVGVNTMGSITTSQTTHTHMLREKRSSSQMS